jgi:hypothetical protein
MDKLRYTLLPPCMLLNTWSSRELAIQTSSAVATQALGRLYTMPWKSDKAASSLVMQTDAMWDVDGRDTSSFSLTGRTRPWVSPAFGSSGGSLQQSRICFKYRRPGQGAWWRSQRELRKPPCSAQQGATNSRLDRLWAAHARVHGERMRPSSRSILDVDASNPLQPANNPTQWVASTTVTHARPITHLDHNPWQHDALRLRQTTGFVSFLSLAISP